MIIIFLPNIIIIKVSRGSNNGTQFTISIVLQIYYVSVFISLVEKITVIIITFHQIFHNHNMMKHATSVALYYCLL